MSCYDYLVVGAGFAGAVLAERLASQGNKRVLVIDKRRHVGGNAHDYCDNDGILVHRYGPHVFHTSSSKVFRYLSQFTTWRKYEHRVLAYVDGLYVPFPINRRTIEAIFGVTLSEESVGRFLDARRERIGVARTAEDAVLGAVGHELCEKFYRHYTRKQWGKDLCNLSADVVARIPVRSNSEDRYFSDKYQYMPRDGFTRLFERVLSHRRIDVELGCDFSELGTGTKYRELAFTGCMDEFFGYEYGPLPYRSIEFVFRTLDRQVAQPVAVVNYPGEEAYTRVTEFKHLTGQPHAKTTVAYEYPRDYTTGNGREPYYPVPSEESRAVWRRYRALAAGTENVHFLGRLGSYRYFDMDQVVGQALATAERLLKGGG